MLRLDIRRPKLTGFVAREEDDPTSLLCVTFKHTLLQLRRMIFAYIVEGKQLGRFFRQCRKNPYRLSPYRCRRARRIRFAGALPASHAFLPREHSFQPARSIANAIASDCACCGSRLSPQSDCLAP